MIYQTDYRQAAQRHWQDAELLLRSLRIDAAGYHYGFAAECAVKHALEVYVPGGDMIRRHFGGSSTDDLRTSALKRLGGRRAPALVAILRSGALLDRWCIGMRYAPTTTITDEQCAAWRKDASRLLGAAGIRR
jgi:hypothetical protein